MRIYKFGNDKNPVILLLPGTACHWKVNFEKQIALLKEKFCVLAVSYDGFDENENTVFKDMISETKKIEKFILKNYGGKIFSAYGCSLGGSFVGLLIQRKKIHITHGILGSSDLDQSGKFTAKLKSLLVGPLFAPIIIEGRMPDFMKKRMEKQSPEDRAYSEKLFETFTANGKGLPFVRKESIRNQFYSDLITPVEDNISVQGTTVHVFYAVRMGKQYEERYKKHFKNPDICYHDYQHEELLFCYPEKWYQEVLRVCGI
ncbi:MAG: alpha/beta hydrolase [Ruminococcus flavefaciens]|nr:alpha/beta hydrolase [Ruminococcus flavefaciens]